MTGGAVGSLVSQVFMLTAKAVHSAVAGAAGGIAATFNTPIAAILLSVELLLFELRPRSLIPVALACAVGVALRPHFLSSGHSFPMSGNRAVNSPELISPVICGLLAAILSSILILSVYACEDGFHKLPIHRMW
ncbi:MAG TPA: chloride channel protein, partial [Gammaproteobacteria bacterium]|nr:chloride channel protein [Gammaproteobacteria bacterium]